MLLWLLAAFCVGLVFGMAVYKYFGGVEDKGQMSTEECVEHLKEKGYGVHLYGQNKGNIIPPTKGRGF